MNFRITYKTHLLISLLAIVFTIIFYDYICSILLNFYLSTSKFFPENITLLYENISVILIIILVSLIHEFLHGLSYKAFGGKVKYSFKIIYAATQEISGKPLTLNQFMITLMAPLVVISLISLLLPVWLGSIIFLMNLLGSFGDIYMSFGLLKYPYYCKIIDKDYGYEILH